MIEIKEKANLLNEEVDALVNTVNCVGIMGKGIALQFKQAYPENFKAYKKACDDNEVKIGKMFITENSQFFQPRFIINFPTKIHWKEKSKLEYIEKGLDDLIQQIKRLGIKSIAIPPLGCGNGGLNWEDVKELIFRKMDVLKNVKTVVFAPSGAPAAREMKIGTKKPNMTPGRAALIGLLKNYKEVGYEITMLEVQKLMYFLQVAGEPLRLNFIKHHYGPYANEINHVLQKIEGHFIKGYGDRTREIQITVLPDGINEAEDFLANHEETRNRFKRVLALIHGFETPYGLELLSTVHWTVSNEKITEFDEIIKSIQDWNSRKEKLFDPDHVRIAKERLDAEHFL